MIFAKRSSEPSTRTRRSIRCASWWRPTRHGKESTCRTTAPILFHLDLPWNPSRLEQRNGRLDRKLQRQDEVRCHYFLYSLREADRVLEVLVERTHTIQRELGSFPPVLEDAVVSTLAGGIAPSRRREITDTLRLRLQPQHRPTVDVELESARVRTSLLQEQIDELREILDRSKKALDLNEESCGMCCLLRCIFWTPSHFARWGQNKATSTRCPDQTDGQVQIQPGPIR